MFFILLHIKISLNESKKKKKKKKYYMKYLY